MIPSTRLPAAEVHLARGIAEVFRDRFKLAGAHAERLRALLQRVEWVADREGDHCPICLNEKKEGHEADCDLVQALALSPHEEWARGVIEKHGEHDPWIQVYVLGALPWETPPAIADNARDAGIEPEAP